MKLKRIFLILTLLSVIITSASLVNMKTNKNAIKAQENKVFLVQKDKLNIEELIVAPQIPKDKVVVESVTLSKNGFLVARKMEGNQLGQIIEMSKPLKKGTHNDIAIPFGSADVSNIELIVMIYKDYANDGIFNDLDMPALNENGNMTARYVKTGKPLSTSITEGESAGMAHTMAGAKTMAKVRYTDKGFVPDKVEVPVGSSVEFINQSSIDMWVASIPHPAHSKLPTFDQFRLYKKGAIYRYVFDKKGTWEYHDHISPSLGGVVVVN